MINHYTELLSDEIQSEITVEKSYYEAVRKDLEAYLRSGLLYTESIVFFEDSTKLAGAVSGAVFSFHNFRSKNHIDYSVLVGVREYTDIHDAIEVYRTLKSKFQQLVGIAFYDDGLHSRVELAILDNLDIEFMAILDSGNNTQNFSHHENVTYRFSDRTFSMAEYNNMGVKAAFINSEKAVNMSMARGSLKNALKRIVQEKKVYFDEFKDEMKQFD